MPFLKAFFLPLRSTQKAFKNFIPYLCFIFSQKWFTSIYNADKEQIYLQKTLAFFSSIVYNSKSYFGVWRSLVSRLVRDQEAMGSNPVTPTRKKLQSCCISTLLELLNFTQPSDVSLTRSNPIVTVILKN